MYNLTNKIITKMRLYTVANIPNSPAYVYAKQYDSNSRFIVATIYDQNGQMIFTNPSLIQLNATNVEGDIYRSIGIMNEDGTISAGLTEQMLNLAGKISCDITIQYPEDAYLKSENSVANALLVIADGEIPSSNEICISNIGISDIEIGDYVIKGYRTVQVTTNTFYVIVEASNYSNDGDVNPLKDTTIKRNDDGTVEIDYIVEDRVDMTFSALNIIDVNITIPASCNYHGFMGGLNIVNTMPKTYSFINNSGYPLVLKLGGDTIQTYTPKFNSETQMSIYCSGVSVVCAIWEV